MSTDKDIWEWFDGEYKVYCDTREIYDDILECSGVRNGGLYIYPDGYEEYDVIIPSGKLTQAKRILKRYRHKNS